MFLQSMFGYIPTNNTPLPVRPAADSIMRILNAHPLFRQSRIARSTVATSRPILPSTSGSASDSSTRSLRAAATSTAAYGLSGGPYAPGLSEDEQLQQQHSDLDASS